MNATTIKVSVEVRDRLKAQASSAHLTLGEHLERLADLADREARFGALAEAIDAMTDEQRADYRRESATWLDADLIARD
jgi:predicted transcriptional regulator